MSSDVIARAIESMKTRPKPLLLTVNALATIDDLEPMAESEVVERICTRDLNDPARTAAAVRLGRWDSARDVDWAEGTEPSGVERRTLVYRLLGLDDTSAVAISDRHPTGPESLLIESDDSEWQPWYTPKRQSEHSFYWDAYAEVLQKSGWPDESIIGLDTSSTEVVRRLADPTWEAPYQSKGLTVGYVQSGKTANFTGVVAKGIDAGYRLIIILTGTLELLRRQTQRRLDMELIGVENIIGGIDENNVEMMRTTDYYGDADWDAGKFLRHGVPIHNVPEIPGITRLSNFGGDYRSLVSGLTALDFRSGGGLRHPGKPLFAPENLFGADVRLAVVKKNSIVLGKLVDDLKRIHADLREIPTLIIDDEADQASVNTIRPRGTRVTREQKERTAINQRISDLLTMLPRAQYVGYTATPFANVFIDPDDSEDIFPKDFILALDRARGYMGASNFHDLDFTGDEKTFENSNEKKFVRDLSPLDSRHRRSDVRAAIDQFVLAGAIKMYRRSVAGAKLRHHTMLVHESVKQIEHRTVADEFREAWRTAGYDSPAGVARLRELYENDVVPVNTALTRIDGETDLPLPARFDELLEAGHLGEALNHIESGLTPVIIVNGDKEKDYEQDELDFQRGEVWKILVGGAKLSRGFTVEGLTVSFYTRRTMAADTLMQMGRWFGFRRGYKDLVRLYIAREVPGPRSTTVDLYEAFEAIVRDEEDFRGELRRFAHHDPQSGKPLVTPADVPPLVFQSLPWLKPTQANKMYNHELVTRGAGGKLGDLVLLPSRGDGAVNVRHLQLIKPLLEELTSTGEFAYDDVTTPGARRYKYTARYGLVPAQLVREILGGFTWASSLTIEPDLRFLDSVIATRQAEDFAVLLPTLSDAAARQVGDYGTLPLLKRVRRADRPGFSGSSKRQRAAVETIAGNRIGDKTHLHHDTSGGPLAVNLHTPTRGALLLTLAYDPADNVDRNPRQLAGNHVVRPEDVAVLPSWAIPYAAAPTPRIGFAAIRSGGDHIVPREAP